MMKTYKPIHPKHIPPLGWIPWNSISLLWLSWISLDGVWLGAALTFFGLMAALRIGIQIILAAKGDWLKFGDTEENKEA